MSGLFDLDTLGELAELLDHRKLAGQVELGSSGLVEEHLLLDLVIFLLEGKVLGRLVNSEPSL